VGAITGVGNALPTQVLRLVELCEQAAAGDVEARRLAWELTEALAVLSKFDEGPDLVLYYKYLMELEGDAEYRYHFNISDQLTLSQRALVHDQWKLFKNWWDNWSGAGQ
jgi:4-hydroxy-tetrahydrodipicolinate synthase